VHCKYTVDRGQHFVASVFTRNCGYIEPVLTEMHSYFMFGALDFLFYNAKKKKFHLRFVQMHANLLEICIAVGVYCVYSPALYT
jgi:hypothetical protein